MTTNQIQLSRLLWFLVEDVRQKSNVFLNEISDIEQSSNYLPTEGNGHTSDQNGRSWFFDSVAKVASSVKREFTNGIHKELFLERLSITMAVRANLHQQPDVAFQTENSLKVLQDFGDISISNRDRAVLQEGYMQWSRLLNDDDSSLLWVPKLVEVLNSRTEWMRRLDVSVNRLRICRRALSERMESLRPQLPSPGRFFRKELKKSHERIGAITSAYAQTLQGLFKEVVYKETQAPPKLIPLLLYDHRNATRMDYYVSENGEDGGNQALNVLICGPPWLGEIPKYIPVIAHELAHPMLAETLRMSPSRNDILRHPFARLIQSLRSDLRQVQFDERFGLNPHNVSMQVDTMVAEVLSDIMSLIVAGPYYLLVLFLSISEGLTVSRFVYPGDLPAAYVRIRTVISAFSEIFGFVGSIAPWKNSVARLLDVYSEYMRQKSLNRGDHVKMALKIEYLDSLVRAFQQPIGEWLCEAKGELAAIGGEWSLKDLRGTGVDQVIRSALKEDWISSDSDSKCPLVKENKLLRGIPSIIWSVVLSRFTSVEKDHEVFTPEGRLLRGLRGTRL